MLQKSRAYAQTTFSSLSLYNYRLYFIGQAISLSGTWMQTIAQTWLIYKLTGSGTAVGLVTAVQFLPILLLGPFGGLLADRFPKRQTLYATQTVALILAGTLATLVLTHSVHVWMVFVLAACLGLVNVVDNPTRQTFVLEMVGREQLTNAVTLNSIEINLARVIGPAIAGFLIAGIGIGYCFLVNAISYIAVLLCLWLMHGHTLQPTPRLIRAKGQLREGFRYVRHNLALRNILLMMTVIGTFSYEFQVVLPLFASETFKAGASGFSLLMASMGVGAVVGGIITTNRKNPSMGAITAAAVAFGVAMLFAAIAPHLLIAALLMVLVGIASISFTAVASSTLQLQTAPEMRGRVMSLWVMAFVGSTPVGGPLMGWISQHSSPRVAMAIGGAADLLVGLYAIISAKRKLPRVAELELTVAVDQVKV